MTAHRRGLPRGQAYRTNGDRAHDVVVQVTWLHSRHPGQAERTACVVGVGPPGALGPDIRSGLRASLFLRQRWLVYLGKLSTARLGLCARLNPKHAAVLLRRLRRLAVVGSGGRPRRTEHPSSMYSSTGRMESCGARSSWIPAPRRSLPGLERMAPRLVSGSAFGSPRSRRAFREWTATLTSTRPETGVQNGTWRHGVFR